MDSLFQLRRPYDFLALAQQEQRAVQVEELKQQLLRHKAHIDMHEDKDVHLEERIYRTDPDCLLAGKSLTEFDLTASTSVPLSDYPELKLDERLLPARDESGELLEPDCEATYDMPAFSMAVFDHLLGVQERRNLSGEPELEVTMLGVRRALDDSDNPDEAGLGSDTYAGTSLHLYGDCNSCLGV
ncbi:hypothetical protein FHG87_009729 [Trinorchestia longiramus]|nr:hypothetical protein FHG87_009729 [Trinorchestia longiramus]